MYRKVLLKKRREKMYRKVLLKKRREKMYRKVLLKKRREMRNDLKLVLEGTTNLWKIKSDDLRIRLRDFLVDESLELGGMIGVISEMLKLKEKTSAKSGEKKK